MTVAPLAAVASAPAPAVPTTARHARFAVPPAPPRPAASPGRAEGHPALSALAVVERAQARIDAVLAAARAGRTFTAAELIGLQAQAYRCAQTVDLAAKLAEQGAQSVKQALNAQL